MAEVNKKGLKRAARQTASEKSDVIDVTRDYAPPVRSLQVSRGMTRSSLSGLGKFDPDKITMTQMLQMRRDPMIALGLHYTKAPIINAVWGIECRDRQIAAFVENALKEIYVPLLVGILTKNHFGFSAMAKRFERQIPDWTYIDEEGNEQDVWPDKDISAVVWRAPRVVPPFKVSPVISKADDSFKGFKVHESATEAAYANADSDDESVDVPAEYAIWVTNELQESFGNMYGYPRTGYAFRYWWEYWYRFMLGSRHFEADADPPLVIGFPTGEVVDPNTDEVIDYADVALQIGNDLRDGATVAIPTDVHVGEDGKASNVAQWSAEFLRGGENMKAFQESYQYLDLMKLRSLLVPDGIVQQTSGATGKNAGSDQAKFFTEAQAVEMGEIDAIINRYIIPQLVKQNFVDPPPCRKVTKRFRSDDLSLAQDIIKLIANVDPQSLNIDLPELIRSVGLPQITGPNVESETAPPPREEEPPGADTGNIDPLADPRGRDGLSPDARPHE